MMKCIFLFFAAMAMIICAFVATAVTPNKKPQKIKIALMTSAFPWSFGPYQSQMYKLSLLLAEYHPGDPYDYEIYWIPYDFTDLPLGTYKGYRELKPHIGEGLPPPKDFKLDHITFLGKPNDGKMSASKFNGLQEKYGFDVLVTLMDINKVVPDDAFHMPVVAWVPLHSETVQSSTFDYLALKQYHGIASLAPSSAHAIQSTVGKEIELNGEISKTAKGRAIKAMFGKPQVEFIPHTFDKEAISKSADIGLEMLKTHSVALADSKLTNSPLVNRGQESTLESGHPLSLFGEERKHDFVILLQGGNYDPMDRKGWDTSIQAFARFYHSLKDASRVHLLIHPFETYIVDHRDDAPAHHMPKGLNLRLALHDRGIPTDAYTIDIALHAPEVVAAYKKRADVCLHPSKVEGFGMNVIECQAVGTPVITTNYTAMGDYTKIGRSVPYLQMIRTPERLYEMALPDVAGITNAIEEMYAEHLALKHSGQMALAKRENEISQFNEWFEATCSLSVVRDKFKSLLVKAYLEFEARMNGKQMIFSSPPPTSGAYEVVYGYHTPIVDWDTPWTLLAADGFKITNPEMLHQVAWTLLLNQGGSAPPIVLVIPTKYEDGYDVPSHNPDGSFHDDLSILVRTFMVTGVQGTMTRRKSIVASVVQSAQFAGGNLMNVPENLAIIDRKSQQGGMFASMFAKQHVEL